MDINIPHRFELRDYQIPFFEAMKTKKRAVLVWHRRAGKEKTSWNYLIKMAIQKVGIYYYFFPHFSQGRKILWDGIDKQGMRFLDHIPSELVEGKPNSTEMKVRLKNGSIIQVVGTNNVDCYDKDTEILTEDGWVFFKDLDQNVKVASLVDGSLEYVLPTKYIEHDYEGEMVEVNSKAIDLLVTPNHRFYVKSRKGKHKFKTADEISVRGDRIPTKSNWKGEEREFFEFPVIKESWVCGKGRVCKSLYDRKIPMDKFVALLGIFLAEGSTYSDHKTYRVNITQIKESTQKEILELLDSLNINYNVYKGQITFEDKQLYKYFSQFGVCDKKFIPKEIKALSSKYLSILFKWMVKGDGWTQGGTISYASTSKKLIDDVQEILLKMSLSGTVYVRDNNRGGYIKGRKVNSIRPLYIIQVRRSKFKSFGNNHTNYISKKNYKGKVYCVSVPSGIVKVRRNGKVTWCGNSIVGTNPIGCVFSEYSLQDPKAWSLIRPILTENRGWAVFNFTPRGMNHSKEIYDMALQNPEWFCQCLTINDTHVISEEDIQRERDDGMSEDYIQQEFYCSFTLGIQGSYYSRYIQRCWDENRITNVPYDEYAPVNTYWDIGVSDETVILFAQNIGQELHLIDMYANQGEGLSHYAKIIDQKAKDNDWIYGTHNAPHDIQVRELGSGAETRLKIAKRLGINFDIVPNLPIMEGVELCRGLFPKMWIDKTKCSYFIKAAENYQKRYNEKLNVYSETPLHNWASHTCDAFRYMAVMQSKHRLGHMSEKDAQKLEDKYSQRY